MRWLKESVRPLCFLLVRELQGMSCNDAYKPSILWFPLREPFLLPCLSHQQVLESLQRGSKRRANTSTLKRVVSSLEKHPCSSVSGFHPNDRISVSGARKLRGGAGSSQRAEGQEGGVRLQGPNAGFDMGKPQSRRFCCWAPFKSWRRVAKPQEKAHPGSSGLFLQFFPSCQVGILISASLCHTCATQHLTRQAERDRIAKEKKAGAI